MDACVERVIRSQVFVLSVCLSLLLLLLLLLLLRLLSSSYDGDGDGDIINEIMKYAEQISQEERV